MTESGRSACRLSKALEGPEGHTVGCGAHVRSIGLQYPACAQSKVSLDPVLISRACTYFYHAVTSSLLMRTDQTLVTHSSWPSTLRHQTRKS